LVSEQRTGGRRYLTRYWIRLESGRHGVRDFGVTASDRDDALRMLMLGVVEPDETFRLIDVEEDVDIASLDPRSSAQHGRPRAARHLVPARAGLTGLVTDCMMVMRLVTDPSLGARCSRERARRPVHG
jgi:hypothetical protein